MHKYKNIQGWAFLLIAALLLMPLLYLYSSQVALHKINRVVNSIELLADNYRLAQDISNLVSNAQDYVLYRDQFYLDRFDEYSTTVIREEKDLYDRLTSDVEKTQFKSLVTLTEEYIFRIQTKIRPSIQQAGNNYDFNSQDDSLSAELKQASENVLIARFNSVKLDISNIMSGQNSISMVLTVVLLTSLVLITIGVSRFFYPMLISFWHTEFLTGHVKEAFLVIDKRGTVTGINEAAEKLLHIPHGILLNKQLDEIAVLYPTLQNVTRPLLNVILEQKRILNNQVVFGGIGERVFLNIDYYPLLFLNRLTGALMVANPVEVQKNKRYLFDTIEAERKKISIEIHDWIGRSMSPIIHQLDYILRANEGKITETVFSDLGRLRTHCQAAAVDMRSIMNDIHPYLIDKVGLISALESYIANYEQMHSINVYLFYQSRTLNTNKALEIIVYRIIQEALINVVKHSSASEVDIYFKEEKDTLKIEILDNGNPSEDIVAGKGLWGMKERANLIGGDIVYSGGEGGFCLTLTVPLAMEVVKNEQN